MEDASAIARKKRSGLKSIHHKAIQPLPILAFSEGLDAQTGEMYRVLRNNGRVGIETWQGIETLPVYLKIYDTVNAVIPVPEEAIHSGFNLGNPDELADLLAAAGFEDVDVTPFSQKVFIDDPAMFTRMLVMGSAMSSAGYITGSLRNLITTGEGQPNPIEDVVERAS